MPAAPARRFASLEAAQAHIMRVIGLPREIAQGARLASRPCAAGRVTQAVGRGGPAMGWDVVLCVLCGDLFFETEAPSNWRVVRPDVLSGCCMGCAIERQGA